MMDMAISFNVAYSEVSPGTGTPIWIMRRDLIRRHYLRGWFIIDFSSILPM